MQNSVISDDEIAALILQKEERLMKLGKVVARIRDEAVKNRAASGIETQWREDEEHYNGEDEYNSSSLSDYTKSRSPDGPLTKIEKVSGSNKGSTAFLNITAPFVDYAAARMGDILLPANEWNFKIEPTPIPELDKIIESSYEEREFALEKKQEIDLKVESAEKRITDWLTECNYKRESRKVIERSAKVGTGILKGPYPKLVKSKVFVDGRLQIIDEIKPASKCISHWDFFPDMACGEDIQNGSYVIEREYMTARQLYGLAGIPGYVPGAVNKVLKEGPGKNNQYSERPLNDDDLFEVWYCHVDIESDDMVMLDDDYAEECACDDQEKPAVSAVVVLVNDTVIKGYLSPYETGEYPYDLMAWKRIDGMPFGSGVARAGRQPQRMLNASIRALMDNMGLSAIPMIGLIHKALIPQDGKWSIERGKLWFLNSEETGIDDIRQAIQTLVVPSLQAELSANIELAMKFMEDTTGITFLLQGQQGSAPDTVGGMNMLHQNATTVLRRSGRVYDENVTEPHIRRYHEFLLINPDVPDQEKGDLQIKAIGSSYLIEREIQAMQLPQLLQLMTSPIFEKSPKKAMDEVLRAHKFDPSKFDMDDEEREQMAAAQQQVAPQVQAAQIRAETDLQKEEIRQQTGLQKMQIDMDRDAVFAEGVTQRNQMAYEKNIADMQLRIQEMELRRELAILEYANKREETLEKIKADLASDVMKIQSTKELVAMKATADQLPKPPVEPAGRAETGESFTQ